MDFYVSNRQSVVNVHARLKEALWQLIKAELNEHCGRK